MTHNNGIVRINNYGESVTAPSDLAKQFPGVGGLGAGDAGRVDVNGLRVLVLQRDPETCVKS